MGTVGAVGAVESEETLETPSPKSGGSRRTLLDRQFKGANP